MILWSGPIRLNSVLTDPTTCGLNSHETSASDAINNAESPDRKLLPRIIFKSGRAFSGCVQKMINLNPGERKQRYCKKATLPSVPGNRYFSAMPAKAVAEISPWRPERNRSVTASWV